MPKKEKLKVVELFAGVGGFRLGLEGWKGNHLVAVIQKEWLRTMKRYGAINGSQA